MKNLKEAIYVSVARLAPITMSLILGPILPGKMAMASNQALEALQPEPTEQDALDSQLKRFKGQTKFLNYYQSINRNVPPRPGMPSEPAPRESAPTASPKRAQQESDIFKVGKAGSKTLFLLNTYRGLQAVSFADGATQPKLLGHVPATGNYPSDMYFDEANDRLIVLERLYYDQSGNYNWYRQQSRLLIYDVKNPSEPKIVSQVLVSGEIADSRLVGDILYVASSIRPNWNNPNEKAKGIVESFKLTPQGVTPVQSQELSLPTSRRENMNIVEVPQGEGYKYYLVAVLSESGWGWWDRQSLVEVVDISDPRGSIQSLLTVSAKGAIQQRSQTSVKNGTLIVASQYWTQTPNSRGLTRIAVESFKLPTADSEILSEDEANFRKVNLDHALKGKSGEEYDTHYKKLVADSALGLQERFIRTADGKFRKIVADSMVTVGDTQGLNTSLQDVRFVDDLLYVFWVPSNNIDPFDLFDISHPEKGIRYIKRLSFDGWISKAIPMNYQGHHYVLGLGWVVPNVDNTSGVRKPQVMLFEVTGSGATARALDIAQLTLQGQMWADFGTADKKIEARFTSDGAGVIMFMASTYTDRSYQTGGKLVGFNLKKAADGDFEGVFKEGALLKADGGWLERVFTNSEIQKVNTFTDMVLGTYDVTDIGSPKETAQAMGLLELARNINSFVMLTKQTPVAVTRGVQIINDTGYWYNWNNDDSNQKTTLRLVNSDQADAEKHQILTETKLKGRYAGHLIDKTDGALWILTQTTQYIRHEGPPSHAPSDHGMPYRPWWYSVIVQKFLTRMSLSGADANTLATDQVIEFPKVESQGYYYYSEGNSELFQTASGRIYLANKQSYSSNLGTVQLISRSKDVGIQSVKMNGCEILDMQGKPDKNRMNDSSLSQVGQSLWFLYKEIIKDPVREDFNYSRNFVMPVKLDGAVAQCGKPINVPGVVIAPSTESHILTLDNRVTEIHDNGSTGQETGPCPPQSIPDGSTSPESSRCGWGRWHSRYDVHTENAYEALSVNGNTAQLADDLLVGSDAYSNKFTVIGDGTASPKLVRLEWDHQNYSNYSNGGAISGSGRFVVLGFDKTGGFTREVHSVPYSLETGAQIADVLGNANVGGKHLALLSTARKLQIMRFDAEGSRPEILKLTSVDSSFKKLESSDFIYAPSWYSGYSNSSGSVLGFSSSLKTLVIPMGYYGALQFYFAD